MFSLLRRFHGWDSSLEQCRLQLCSKTETEPRGGTLCQPHHESRGRQHCSMSCSVVYKCLQWNDVACCSHETNPCRLFAILPSLIKNDVKLSILCPLFPQILTPGLHQVQLSFLKALSKRLAFASSLANALVLTMCMAAQRTEESKTRIDISFTASSWSSFSASETESL